MLNDRVDKEKIVKPVHTIHDEVVEMLKKSQFTDEGCVFLLACFILATATRYRKDELEKALKVAKETLIEKPTKQGGMLAWLRRNNNKFRL